MFYSQYHDWVSNNYQLISSTVHLLPKCIHVLYTFLICSSRIDARTLKALYFAWDQTEESEQNWMSIVEGTHSDIIALKNKTNRRNTKGATSSSKEKSPSIRQLRQVHNVHYLYLL